MRVGDERQADRRCKGEKRKEERKERKKERTKRTGVATLCVHTYVRREVVGNAVNSAWRLA